EYVDHVYIQFLGKLSSEFQKFQEPNRLLGRESVGPREFRATLDSLVAEIIRHPAREVCLSPHDENHELHLHRMSQLKKIFQSDMFVEVSSKEVIKRLKEPVAAIAAGMAAIWATFFQFMATPKAAKLGFSGVIVFCVGIIAYIMKDRIKDQGRALITKKIT